MRRRGMWTGGVLLVAAVAALGAGGWTGGGAEGEGRGGEVDCDRVLDRALHEMDRGSMQWLEERVHDERDAIRDGDMGRSAWIHADVCALVEKHGGHLDAIRPAGAEAHCTESGSEMAGIFDLALDRSRTRLAEIGESCG